MKYHIGIDVANGEDWTAEALIKNGQIVSVGLFRKNSQDEEFQKVLKETRVAIMKRFFIPNLRKGSK